jgi:hypothetical protein
MEWRRCLLLSTIAVALACSEHDGPMNPDVPPSVFRPGDSALVAYDPNRFYEVEASQRVDIGVWQDSGTIAMFGIALEGTAAPVETIRWLPYTILPAFDPQVGRFRFRITASNPFCLGGPPGHCTTSGKHWLRVRASAPIARMASAVGGVFENMNTPFHAVFPRTINYTGTTGAAVLDTLFVANGGTGSFTAALANAQSWLQLDQSSVTAVGPMRVREQPNAFVVLRRGQLAAGVYHDTITITGMPTDDWSLLMPTRVAISLQIN